MLLEEIKKTVSLLLCVILGVWVLFLGVEGPKEYVWFLLPVIGLIWQVGGTWQKNIRRLWGNLILSVIPCVYFLEFNWIILLSYASYFGVCSLPITLKGDSIPGWWFNWVWVFILGGLLGLCSIFLGVWVHKISISLWCSLIPSLTYGIFTVFSNLKETRDWFVWKLCEFFFGVSIAIPVAMLIQNS